MVKFYVMNARLPFKAVIKDLKENIVQKGALDAIGGRNNNTRVSRA
jgi:hypothetical protein